MRLRTIGLAAALSASLFQTSDAVVQPKGAEGPVVAATQAPRLHRTIAWSRDAQLAAVGLPGWTAIWDRDTDVPLRLWGPGLAAPGAMTDPAIAEAAARQFLATHLALLAPGARAADFVVVANQLGGAGDVRSVGFAQHAGGIRVLGGAIGVSFKADRLIMVSSTALPNVAISATPRPLDLPVIVASATRWLAAAGHTVRLRAAHPARVILPLVRPRGATGPAVTYRVAEQLVGRGGRRRRPVGRLGRRHRRQPDRAAQHDPLRLGQGPVRRPRPVPDRGARRQARPERDPPDRRRRRAVRGRRHRDLGRRGRACRAGLRGPFVEITNQAGSLVAETLALVDGADVVWSKATEEFNDAQLSAFVFASLAKAFARAHLNPTLGWLDRAAGGVRQRGLDVQRVLDRRRHPLLPAGHQQQRGRPDARTPARLADVVYHEFGHSLHANSIIEGVGQFDGALSEGMSDMLAAFITDDSGHGPRASSSATAPLRELDPAVDKRWPEDVTGEVHDDGEIIGGTLWDLRKALERQARPGGRRRADAGDLLRHPPARVGHPVELRRGAGRRRRRRRSRPTARRTSARSMPRSAPTASPIRGSPSASRRPRAMASRSRSRSARRPARRRAPARRSRPWSRAGRSAAATAAEAPLVAEGTSYLASTPDAADRDGGPVRGHGHADRRRQGDVPEQRRRSVLRVLRRRRRAGVVRWASRTARTTGCTAPRPRTGRVGGRPAARPRR